MCGITGFISSEYDKNDLIRMTESLAHRGPNASGLFYNKSENIGLGHRRLSILDLSEESNQPMNSHNSRYVMVFNGEIYNYKTIADKLNISLKTSSDSEVLLEAFCHWGLEFANELNGMFSILIYDKQTNDLFMFRDRLGIKPLFYHWDKSHFIFGSELKSIKASGVQLKLNTAVIPSYLHLGYIPQNHTIYKDTYKLPAGSYGILKGNHFETRSYWQPETHINKEIISNYSEAKLLLDHEINLAVERRLMSDVPLGTFLSGGIDSSLISAIATKQSSTKLNTFSIGFKDAKHNESVYASKVAEHLGSNHHEFLLTQDDALDQLERIMDNFDQPFADSSALPTYLVSKMAKKYVSVCLSGDGGDELFMGYGSYNWAKRLSNPLLWSLRKPISNLLDISSNPIHNRASWLFKGSKQNTKSHIFSQEQYLFSEQELSTILKSSNSSHIDSLNKEPTINRVFTASENQAFYDLNNYLKDDLLVKVDMASMQNSLELRVPLLDHNVVSLALNINEKFKVHPNGTQKHILKEVLYDYVPKEYFDRSKWGFSIPLQNWLQSELHYLIDKYLNTNTLIDLDIYNVNEIEMLVNRFEKGETILYNKIWSIIVLNRYLLQN
jgi:asparagine synthase (glutamine-hydrolysing)